MENLGNSETKRRRLDEEYSVTINKNLLTEETIKKLQNKWTIEENVQDIDLSEIQVRIIKEPFTVCVIDNFLENTEILEKVAEEIDDFEFLSKSNDLYQFCQSDDLQNITSEICKTLYKFLAQNVRLWLSKIFNIEFLTKKVASTFSSYSYTDRLLCHDDKCEDRHIAFVLYLNKEWCDEWGGDLQLFNHDNNLDPNNVVKSIKFKHNRMVMFEVTHKSFHQVAEVVKQETRRLSLNGWFHSEVKLQQAVPLQPTLETNKTFPCSTTFDFHEYISSEYLDTKYFIAMKKKFKHSSEMELDDFFTKTFYRELIKSFNKSDINWKFVGPANIRRYEVAEFESLPLNLQKLKEMFESECWFEYLSVITGLDLVPDENTDMSIWDNGILPHCNVELQRWTPSCYTLVHDRDAEFHSDALDLFIRIPTCEEIICCGTARDDDTPESGVIVYLDKMSKDDECLLECGRKFNSQSLVYREKETVRFVKYMDVESCKFFQISCTYRQWSPSDNQPNVKLKSVVSSEDEEDDDSASGGSSN